MPLKNPKQNLAWNVTIILEHQYFSTLGIGRKINHQQPHRFFFFSFFKFKPDTFRTTNITDDAFHSLLGTWCQVFVLDADIRRPFRWTKPRTPVLTDLRVWYIILEASLFKRAYFTWKYYLHYIAGAGTEEQTSAFWLYTNASGNINFLLFYSCS